LAKIKKLLFGIGFFGANFEKLFWGNSSKRAGRIAQCRPGDVAGWCPLHCAPAAALRIAADRRDETTPSDKARRWPREVRKHCRQHARQMQAGSTVAEIAARAKRRAWRSRLSLSGRN
jgi:hypothetical protein